MTIQCLPTYLTRDRVPARRARAGKRQWLGSDMTQVLITREVARADRAGNELSMVLVRTSTRKKTALSTARLKRVIETRARDTDDLGWFDADHLCVLMPNTPAEGAARFAEDIRRKISSFAPCPPCAMYTYPAQWVPSDPFDGVTESAVLVDRRGNGAQDLNFDAPVPASSKAIEQLLLDPMPWWKRSMDIGCASVGLLAALPVMLLIAAAVKIDSKGPILFTQRRAGFGGTPFRIYKFRTMVPDAEAQKKVLRAQSEQDGPAFKIKDDPRQTKFGRWLRKTSLDELPQLWNVLIGDMSLVGPRPLPIDESNGCLSWQRHRLCVRPGLTCTWQVEGRSRVTFDDWVRMDVRYIRSRSFLNDVRILARTVPAVLRRRGAC